MNSTIQKIFDTFNNDKNINIYVNNIYYTRMKYSKEFRDLEHEEGHNESYDDSENVEDVEDDNLDIYDLKINLFNSFLLKAGLSKYANKDTVENIWKENIVYGFVKKLREILSFNEYVKIVNNVYGLNQKLLINSNEKFNVFPPDIKKYYYTDTKDLTYTTNFQHFINSKADKFISKLNISKDDIFIDMTSNIGCDTANIHYVFPDNLIFSCDIREMSSIACSKNCPYSYVCNGDSNKLVKGFYDKNVEVLKQMCINKSQKINEKMIGRKYILIIDPPFSNDTQDYNEAKKEKETEELKFPIDNKYVEISKYIKDNDFINNAKYIILKSPKNWNCETKRECIIKTKKSFYKYNIIENVNDIMVKNE